MKRDSIFYKLFQQYPFVLFELLKAPPANADAYSFDCVAVKESKFEIDGVFLPPSGERGIVYFCEVQFQQDEMLYERLVSEATLYFYRNREKFSNWQAVVIYPSQGVEQSDVDAHQFYFKGGQIHRVFLNKLGDIRKLPIWVALMVLTTKSEKTAPDEAKYLLSRSKQEPEPLSGAIIEMVTSIMVSKFEQFSRKDIDTMLGITVKETRVYREAKEEGREEQTVNLIARLLKKRFGQDLSEEMRVRIESLPLPTLESLSEDLLDFTSFDDLQPWLDTNAQ
jgi:predicted transposase/invertase (TIGR01784 family)